MENERVIITVSCSLAEALCKSKDDIKKVYKDMVDKGIINDDPIELSKLLYSLLLADENEANTICTFYEGIQDDYIVEIINQLLKEYYSVPVNMRKLRNKQAIVEKIIYDNQLDSKSTLSVHEFSEDIVHSLLGKSNEEICQANCAKENIENNEDQLSDFEKILLYMERMQKFLENILSMDLNMNKREWQSEIGVKEYKKYIRKVQRYFNDQGESDDYVSRKEIEENAEKLNCFFKSLISRHHEHLIDNNDIIEEIREEFSDYKFNFDYHGRLIVHYPEYSYDEEFEEMKTNYLVCTLSAKKAISEAIFEPILKVIRKGGEEWYQKLHREVVGDYEADDPICQDRTFLRLYYKIYMAVFAKMRENDKTKEYQDIYEELSENFVDEKIEEPDRYFPKNYRCPSMVVDDWIIGWKLNEDEEKIFHLKFCDCINDSFDAVKIKIEENNYIETSDWTQYDDICDYEFLDWGETYYDEEKDMYITPLEVKFTNSYYGLMEKGTGSLVFTVYTTGNIRLEKKISLILH